MKAIRFVVYDRAGHKLRVGIYDDYFKCLRVVEVTWPHSAQTTPGGSEIPPRWADAALGEFEEQRSQEHHGTVLDRFRRGGS